MWRGYFALVLIAAAVLPCALGAIVCAALRLPRRAVDFWYTLFARIGVNAIGAHLLSLP